ncbi:hypothetical protein EPO33_05255 [Patescibacteria group bacterium]|nr:MAG: hypothetical protein EPO33_05255 [Patescibacteria group bacterium]
MHELTKRVLVAALTCLLFPSLAQAATVNENANLPFTPAVPTLQLPIPTLPSFSTLVVQGEGGNRYVDIPFVAEYILAIYRFSIGVIVTFAMVMIVIGGIRWVTAAGNASTIGAARDTIIRAIMGLLLALGSYTILYLINPELVNFRSIRVDLVRRVEDPAASEADIDPGTYTPPAGGAGGGAEATSADCTRLAELVTDGTIGISRPNDRAGILAGGTITRNACIWCYNGSNDRSSSGACFDEGDAAGVQLSPNTCRFLVLLGEAKARGDLSGPLRVATLIGNHSRCASGRADTAEGRVRCAACMESARSGGHEGESNHWDGRGIDFANNAALQRYIVETIARPGLVRIKDVFGHYELSRDEVICEGSTRTGTATGPLLMNEGRFNATIGARTMCGHYDHIHVSVY